MKQDYWIVEDSLDIEKTGKSLSHWTTVLDAFQASDKSGSTPTK